MQHDQSCGPYLSYGCGSLFFLSRRSIPPRFQSVACDLCFKSRGGELSALACAGAVALFISQQHFTNCRIGRVNAAADAGTLEAILEMPSPKSGSAWLVSSQFRDAALNLSSAKARLCRSPEFLIVHLRLR